MSEDRWMKNAERVREICKTMGFRLVGFDPSWSIVQGNVKMPKNPLVVWANDSIGRYMQIPDEFMANTSLMMGYGWDFEESDEDVKKSITQIESMLKAISEPYDCETPIKKSKKGKGKEVLYNLHAEIKEMREADIQEYKQRIKRLNYVLETRKNLRDWSKDN